MNIKRKLIVSGLFLILLTCTLSAAIMDEMLGWSEEEFEASDIPHFLAAEDNGDLNLYFMELPNADACPRITAYYAWMSDEYGINTVIGFSPEVNNTPSGIRLKSWFNEALTWLEAEYGEAEIFDVSKRKLEPDMDFMKDLLNEDRILAAGWELGDLCIILRAYASDEKNGYLWLSVQSLSGVRNSVARHEELTGPEEVALN